VYKFLIDFARLRTFSRYGDPTNSDTYLWSLSGDHFTSIRGAPTTFQGQNSMNNHHSTRILGMSAALLLAAAAFRRSHIIPRPYST